jgi:hypothetical protein
MIASLKLFFAHLFFAIHFAEIYVRDKAVRSTDTKPIDPPVVSPPQQQSYSNPPTQASNQHQATEQHETTNNLGRLMNLMVVSIQKQPRSNSPARKRPVPGNSGDFVEAVFRSESTGNWQESTGKNPDNFWPEYCFHVPALSGVFVHDPVTWPHLSCRILRGPVAEIFILEDEINRKQDEINQKLFDLTNRILPIVERIEKHLVPGAALNVETKLQRNVSFRNKYCNKYDCFK